MGSEMCIRDRLDTLIQNGVDYATKLGMYALVDWHVHAYNPNEYLKEAKIFFTKYATMYKDHDNVLYEICNEPTGTNWYSGNGKDLYTYCSEVIKTIRAIDPDAIIICGTNTWSQDVDQVAAKPMKALGYENIMYTFHFYSASHKENLMEKVRLATKDGTPIFVTEFGVCSADGNGSYDTESADRWIALLDELNISFACWSYSNCNEKSAYFKSSCSNAGGDWTADDLTTTGKWLINTCRAHEEKENASYPAVSPSAEPTKAPTVTEKPTTEPTKAPTVTVKPTAEPTKAPTVTVKPTAEPTKAPTVTEKPTAKPIKTPTPTAEPTKAPEPTAAPEPTTAPGAGYKDGSYTGTGEGFNGQVTVTINVSGGNIVSAGYDGEDDEPEFSNAWNGIYNQIMGKQSADGIDTVTDATYSSNGLIQAFQSAISQAK